MIMRAKARVRILAAVVAAIFLGSAAPQSALAWGAEGHRVIAEIAEKHLSPAAAARVAALLQADGAPSLAAISVWADDYRVLHPETGSWHFVDIPVAESRYNAQRDCPGNNCVVAKINEMAGYLRNPSTPLDGQVMALKYLVHFVGDIHQPLHCADRRDAGGNKLRVKLGKEFTNLHHIWDTELIAMAGGHDASALAADLDAQISGQDVAAWLAKKSVEEWANETHRVAIYNAYADLPDSKVAVQIDQAYLDAAEPVALHQLQVAGIRLASTLNAIFGK
ncbi:S1/P1 nuclease [Desulfovibrio sp.]|uniref:S1/P1 nuclease n=1 Tax=Desulfovibrio sp. TaxID=885 RepID=UPI0025BA3F49|nr:S1/P1 nuclease [Desulfovibrio sp.]